MNLLFETLPPGMKGTWREKSQDLLTDILPQIENKDIIFVKGSKGSRMGLIVCGLEALKIKEK
jgi:UDP-N-acetylmuramyl pentapeptide synthase